ncbi:MAG: hypothetical protein KDI68_13075 [Gammaproteobacteria bacterium]|nr:hypothetical protein [Gammaproteobacteria bacterium]
MQEFPIDPDSKLVDRCYALVYAAGRKRARFPENCVQIVDSREAALAGANEAERRYPAVVYGPSRSSEGLRLYYLVEWLEN